MKRRAPLHTLKDRTIGAYRRWRMQKRVRKEFVRIEGKRRTNPVIVIAAISVVAILSMVAITWAVLRPSGFDESNEFLRTSAQLIAGTALLTGLVFTYLTVQNSRETLDHQKSVEKNQRFFDAVEKLGDSQEVVRIAAIHTLASLYKDLDSFEHIILGVYIKFLHQRADKRVPHEKTPQDIPAVLNILGRMQSMDKLGGTPHCELDDLNFSGVEVGFGAFAGKFRRTWMMDSHWFACTFLSCDFGEANFSRAILGGHFDSCSFDNANLRDTDLMEAAGLDWESLDYASLSKNTKLNAGMERTGCVWRSRPLPSDENQDKQEIPIQW